MNKKIIVYLLGWIMNMEAIFMLIPCVRNDRSSSDTQETG